MQGGPSSGSVPNVTWRRVDEAHLHAHPLYVALPPANDVRPRDAAQLRLFSQRSWQWDALHEGRLTTAKLAALLGVYEPGAAAKLNVPRSLRGHERAVSAFAHLRAGGGEAVAHGLLRPPAADAAPDSASDSSGGGGGGSGAPTLLDVITGAGVLPPAELAAMAAAALGGSAAAPLPQSSDCGTWRRPLAAQDDTALPNNHHLHQPHLFAYHPPRTAGGSRDDSGMPPSGSGYRLHARSETAARLAWGSEQEATAVLAALNHLVAEPLAATAAAAGTGAGAGGSRRAPLVPAQVLATATASATILAASSLPSSPSAAVAHVAAAASRMYEVGMCVLEAVPLPGDPLPPSPPPPAATVDSIEPLPTAADHQAEVDGSSSGGSDDDNDDAQQLPSLATLAVTSRAPDAGAGGGGSRARKRRQRKQRARVRARRSSPAGAASATAAAAGCSPNPHRFPPRAALPLMGASPDGLLVYGDGTVEVVEVKCHSPFAAAAAAASADGSGGQLRLSDGGPQPRVGAWHVPQLALEMLCAGPHCASAVLVSLSATRGAVLHRLRRDDAYIGLMLRVAARLVAAHAPPLRRGGHDGAAQPPPPPPPLRLPTDYAAGVPEYAHFLDATLAQAARATVIATLPHESVQRSPHNGRWFWDDPSQQDRPQQQHQSQLQRHELPAATSRPPPAAAPRLPLVPSQALRAGPGTVRT